MSHKKTMSATDSKQVLWAIFDRSEQLTAWRKQRAATIAAYRRGGFSGKNRRADAKLVGKVFITRKEAA